MARIENPVLRGFNPDPSILRVGEEYFLATSTFEYQPAVRIHRSADLATWEIAGHALHDLDLRGIPDSGGVWAPSLTHVDGEFWLAYSVVRTMDGDDKDIDNYLVTGPSPLGPWSEPVHLGSRGFDFSFFHDDDGTHWIVGVQWDQRPEHPSFSGIVVEQYLPEDRRTSGVAHRIYAEEGLVEGPNLYRIGGEYLLLLAAGGTGWNHGISAARSRSLLGPYARDTAEAVLTTRDAPGATLQKAGHGELVETPEGEWVLTHLATRPALHLGERYGTLGRETCLQSVVFEDGWPRLAHGGHHPAQSFAVSGDKHAEAEDVPPASGWTDDFDRSELDTLRWSTLRVPAPQSGIDLEARPGWLRLHGGHSTASVFEQSTVLTRVEEHDTEFETIVDGDPRSPREAAGLIAWYDRSGWIWLQLTWDPDHGRHLRVVRRDDRTTIRSAAVPVPAGELGLRAHLDGAALTFSYAIDGGWRAIDGTFPAWTLSDDHGPRLRFTGMFLGLRAEDLDGRGWSADFARAEVRTRP
ncbi:family 43 glycosylhydrolase [Microbacterium gilvum]|uniref:Glycoside hydrolase family 43 protein n=1 Tax=Microbacterium gilvum TaxID=1336204 RepID=A0ABP9A9R2_9MICO